VFHLVKFWEQASLVLSSYKQRVTGIFGFFITIYQTIKANWDTGYTGVFAKNGGDENFRGL